MPNYLTEQGLYKLLAQIYPTETFIRDRQVPNSGTKKRPDFRCDNIKLIVEFDGDEHYKSARKIKNEEAKNINYSEMGYKVVRIPYFVQPSSKIIKKLFDIDIEYEQTYAHGFIDTKVVLPADFCEMGLSKFVNNLEQFSEIKPEIINSLINKINELDDIDLVIPQSIRYLICL